MEFSPAPTTSRRYKRTIVSFEFLRDLFSEGDHSSYYRVVRDSIPADAILVNARFAWPNCLELLIYSESFPETKDGEEYPLLNPTCETQKSTVAGGTFEAEANRRVHQYEARIPCGKCGHVHLGSCSICNACEQIEPPR